MNQGGRQVWQSHLKGAEKKKGNCAPRAGCA